MKHKVVLIGGSAGSLEVLLQVFPDLRADLSCAIILVLHRKVSTDYPLSRLLGSKTKLPVREVEEKDMIMPGNIYIAPADYHLLVEHDHTFSLDDSEKVNYSRPSIDVTFESAAEAFGESIVAILLSGANADGVEGLKAIKESGGIVIAQDPESADVSYMPQQAVNNLALDKILGVDEMAAFINSLG